MRILLIDVNYGVGSTGKIVKDLKIELENQRHEVLACYGRGKKIKEKNVMKFGLDWETYLHVLLARVTGLNGYFSYFSTKRLIKFIDKFQPDIIHIHELHAYFVNIFTLIEYIKKKNIKIIWTFHCEYMYTGKCGYTYECKNWKKECKKCPKINEYPKSIFFDKTLKMFKDKKRLLQDLNMEIVVPSKWLAKQVRNSFLSNKNIHIIHNGINNTTIFYPRDKKEIVELKRKYELKRRVILAVAPNIMDERKGGKLVLEIAKNMLDLDFILVGTKETKKYAQNIQLISNTRDQNELAQWYSLADLFLICSKKENFPTTCLEALSCGTPIVGIDEGGSKETAPFPYGIFVNNNIEDLIRAIREQLRYQHDNKMIVNLARDRYSSSKMTESYHKLYLKVKDNR